jgi:HK97 gp10 family phage protein
MTVNTYGALFSPTKITPAIRRAAGKARAYGEYRIKARTPIRTGLLHRSWQVDLEGYGVRVRNNTPYAIYNEMGTRYMRARPMVAPTIPEMQAVFKTEIGREVGRSLGNKILGELRSITAPGGYRGLTEGRRYIKGNRGFRTNPDVMLEYTELAKLNRRFGKAFPAFPGQLQSPKANRVGAR